VTGLCGQDSNQRFAWDSYRRFVQMYGNVVVGVAGDDSKRLIASRRPRVGWRWIRSSTPTT